MAFVWIYGTNTTKVRSKRPKEIKCHACGKEDHIQITSWSDYCYFWFIPLFPINVYSTLECVSCQYEYPFKDLDDKLKLHYAKHRPRWVIPFYNFMAWYIVLIVFIALSFHKKSEQKEFIQRLDTIRVNYVVDYKTEDGDYSNFIIHSIQDSTYYVSFNKYVIEDEHFLGQIEGKSNFSSDTLEMQKTELKKWIHEDRVSAMYPMN